MSSIKRHINFTKRKRIRKRDIIINELGSSPLKVKIFPKLAEYEFPVTAKVIVEAYSFSGNMYFNYGTIGQLNIPDELTIDKISQGVIIKYRVKIVDTEHEKGKLLGLVKGLRLKGKDEKKGRRNLLPVLDEKLRPYDIWKVNIQADALGFMVNDKITNFDQQIEENPMLKSFILPVALRFVLNELVKSEDNGEYWKEDWLTFCRQNLDKEDDPRDYEDDKAGMWIDEAVNTFCRKFKLIDNVVSKV